MARFLPLTHSLTHSLTVPSSKAGDEDRIQKSESRIQKFWLPCFWLDPPKFGFGFHSGLIHLFRILSPVF